jgi:hypothetical protein
MGERKAEDLEEDNVEICLQLTVSAVLESASKKVAGQFLGFTFSEN